MNKKEGERLATVEAKVEGIDRVLREEVVPTLREISAYQNRQKGYIAASVLFLTAVGSALVAFANTIWNSLKEVFS